MFNNPSGQFSGSISSTPNVDPREVFGHPPEQVVFHQNPNNSASWFQFMPSPMSTLQDFSTNKMNLKVNSQQNAENPKFDFESILKSQISQINPASATQNTQMSNDFDLFLRNENTKSDNSPFLKENPIQNEENYDPDFDVFNKPKDLFSFQENNAASKNTDTKQNSNDIFGLFDQSQPQKAIQSNPTLEILSKSTSDPDFDVFKKKPVSDQPLLIIDSVPLQSKNEMNLIDFSIPKTPQKQQIKQQNSNDLISFDMTKRKETNNLIQFNKNLEKENLKKQKEEIENRKRIEEIKKRKEEHEKQKKLEEERAAEMKRKLEVEQRNKLEEEKEIKRILEEKKKKEEEKQRKLEEERIAELKRIEEQKKREELERKKKMEEEQEKQRILEEEKLKKLKEEQENQKKLEEEKKRIELEKQKKMEEEKRIKEQEKQRKLEEERIAELKRNEEELERKKKMEEEKQKKIEEEKRIREEQERQRLLEEKQKQEEENLKKLKEEQEKLRIEEERRIKEEQERQRILEQKKLEEEKQRKLEEERAAEMKRIEEQKKREELEMNRKIEEERMKEEQEKQKKLEEEKQNKLEKEENEIDEINIEENTKQDDVKWEFGDDKEFEGMEVVDLLSKDNEYDEENEINDAVSRDVDFDEENSSNKTESEAKLSDFGESLIKKEENQTISFQFEENKNDNFGGFFSFDDEKKEKLKIKKEEIETSFPSEISFENNSEEKSDKNVFFSFENNEKETDNLGNFFDFDENETETKISEIKESSIKNDEFKPSFHSLDQFEEEFNPSFPAENQFNNDISNKETDNLGGFFDFDQNETETKISEIKESLIKNNELVASEINFEDKTKEEENESKTETKISEIKESLIQKEEFNPSFSDEVEFLEKSAAETDNLGGFFDFGENETETKITEIKESLIKNDEFNASEIHFEDKTKEETKTESKIRDLQESLIEKEEFNPSFPDEVEFGEKSAAETDNLGGFFDFDENEKDKTKNNETETKITEIKESSIKNDEFNASEIHFEDKTKEENESITETKISEIKESLIQKEDFNPSFPTEEEFGEKSAAETDNLRGFFDFGENETETKVSEIKESSIKNDEFNASEVNFEDTLKVDDSKTETKISNLQESLIQKEEFNPSFPNEDEFSNSKQTNENFGGFFDLDEKEEKTKSETKISDFQESSINKEELEFSFPTEDQFQNNENENKENEFGISFPTEEFNVSFQNENASELKTDNLSNFFSSEDEKENKETTENVSFPTEILFDEEKSEINPEISFQNEEKENSENFDISGFKIHFFDPEKESKTLDDNLILKNNFATTKFKVLHEQYEQKQKANENNTTIDQINNMIVNENSLSTSVVFVNESQTHDEINNLNETEEIGNLEIDEIIEPKNLQIDNEEIDSIKEITSKEEKLVEEVEEKVKIANQENEEKLEKEINEKEIEEIKGEQSKEYEEREIKQEEKERNQVQWNETNSNESVEFTEEFENFVEKIENDGKEMNEYSHSVEANKSISIDDIEADTNLFIFPEFIPLDESIAIDEEKEKYVDNSNFVSAYINKIKNMKENSELKPMEETTSYKIFNQYFRENFK